MKRGIVTAPGILNQINNGFKMERGLSLNELKYYTLYFDELVIPDNNIKADAQILVKGVYDVI